jgi:hypothetical protein
MVFPLHFAGVSLMDVKKTFGIKDEATKHIPGAKLRADIELEYSSFTKAQRLNMVRVVCDCSRRICEIVCPGNAQALLDDVAVSLSESPSGKQTHALVESMLLITSELHSNSVQRRALFAPLAQHFTMKQLRSLMQKYVDADETVGRERFRRGRVDFARLFEGRNINRLSYRINGIRLRR